MFHTKLLVVQRVDEQYAGLFPEGDKSKKEAKEEEDETGVNEFLSTQAFDVIRLLEVLTESAPMIVVASLNATLVGNPSLAFIVSIAASSLNVLNYVYAYTFSRLPCVERDPTSPVGFFYEPYRKSRDVELS